MIILEDKWALNFHESTKPYSEIFDEVLVQIYIKSYVEMSASVSFIEFVVWIWNNEIIQNLTFLHILHYFLLPLLAAEVGVPVLISSSGPLEPLAIYSQDLSNLECRRRNNL